MERARRHQPQARELQVKLTGLISTWTFLSIVFSPNHVRNSYVDIFMRPLSTITILARYVDTPELSGSLPSICLAISSETLCGV